MSGPRSTPPISLSKLQVCRVLRGIGFLAAFFAVTLLVFMQLSQTADARFTLTLNSSLGEPFTTLMVLASRYGRGYFWGSILLVMILLGKRETRFLGLELAALIVIGVVSGEVIKHTLYRIRPFESVSGIVPRSPAEYDSSYVSGHALIASIGAFFSVAKFKNNLLRFLLPLEGAIVCYSRVYIGMHYVTDVIAAVFLAGAIVQLGLYLLDGYLKEGIVNFANQLQHLFKRIGIPEIL